MKYDLLLTGQMVTHGPITIVTPDAPKVKLGLRDIPEHASIPMRRGPDTLETINVPVIPGSTLRGRLRRVAATLWRARLDNKPSMADYLVQTVGGVKGAESEDVFDIISRSELRAASPLLGLFGSSTPWVNGRAMIGMAVPEFPIEAITVGGVRTDPVARAQSIFDELDDEAPEDYLEMRGNARDVSLLRKELADIKATLSKVRRGTAEGDIKVLNAEITRVEKEIETAQKKGKSVSTQMPHAHRALPAHTTLNHSIRLLGVTEVEMGLFLSALSAMFEFEPLIGGKPGVGYGEVSAAWDVEIREQWGKLRSLDRLVATPFRGVEISHPELLAAVAAWDNFKVAQPEPEAKRPAKAAKAAKKAKAA